jgi:hypothetical protein
MVADAGHPVASDEPSVLVADAVVDTLTGVAIWDRRYSLGYHLCSVVRTRTSNQITRTRRLAHVSLEAAGDGDALVAPESIAGERAPVRPDALLENAQVAHELYGTVRARAHRDAPLAALLDAYAVGFSKPREVMKLTGMTRTDFLNARRRLDRMLAKVPAELLRAALESIR